MRFLLISDAHGSVENIERLESEFRESDAVIFAGDFARFGAPETGRPVLEKMASMHDTIFSVIGNCDEPGFLAETEDADINVEGTLAVHGGLSFIGAGGGTKFSGDTPFERTEEEILSDFSILDSAGVVSGENLVLIMHNPPKDTDCDRIPAGVHVGSQKLRELIERLGPLLVVTGHIHESAGICRVGNSTVVNPGALLEGKYAVAEIRGEGGEWKVSAELKSL